jgi:hypothetical protein
MGAGNVSAILALREFEDVKPSTFTPIRRTPAVAPSGAAVFDVISADWLAELRDRLLEVMSLPVGWDGYGGKPTSAHAATTALTFLISAARPNTPAPSVVPLSGGGVQFEWHRKGWDLEMEVMGFGAAQLFSRELATGTENDTDLVQNPAALRAFLATISD